MSRRGENIHKRKDGRWEGRLPILDEENKIIKYQSVYAHSYKEVKALMKQKQQQEPYQTKKKKTQITTMQMLCEQWLKEIQAFVKQSTYARYKQIVNKHILSQIASLDVSKITNEQISLFIRDKITNGRLDGNGGLSPKTIQDIFTILKQILSYGYKKGYTPVLDYDFIKLKAEQNHFSVFSISEQTKLVLYLRNNLLLETLGILLCLYTGIRIGELCALTWNDIDMQNSVLHINKTLQRIQNTDKNINAKTRIVIDKPKSNKSIRDIPIPEFLWKLLFIHSKKYSKEAYFLTGKINQYTEPRVMQYKFKTHLEKAELADRNIHALRHTFATRAIEQKMDVKTLSEILGHSSVKFTLERYVYSSYDLKVQSMEKMATCF